MGVKCAGEAMRGRCIWAATASALALMIGGAAIPQAAMAQTAPTGQIELDIPAQDLNRALLAFTDKAGLQIFYDVDKVAGKRSSAVRGSHAPMEALSRLLAGTGLTFRSSGGNRVTLEPAPQAADGTVQLGTLRVEGASGQSTGYGDTDGRGEAADAPYRTAGSSNHVSRAQIDRVPPTSPGDIFAGVPGVVNSGTHSGASLNVNIRGMQGMGRVTTTVDGSHQTSTSFRGYAGSRDETYVDPDLIGSIDIAKGPGTGVGAGVGGSVALRTLAAQDIVPEGQEWAIRLRGSLGNNSDYGLARAASDPDWMLPTPRPSAAERPDFLGGGDTWSGSIALGVKQDHFDGIIAYNRRRQGNYFSGKNAPDDMVFATGNLQYDARNAHSAFQPGSEVFNTSQDTESFLLKGRLLWGDGESLELGFMRYDSDHGELNENANTRTSPPLQYRLSNTRVDTYTARYRLLPADNPLLRLRANIFYTDLSVDRGGSEITADHGMKTFGGDIDNRSLIDTGLGLLTVNAGAEYRREQAWAEHIIGGLGWTSWGPSGVRAIGGAFVGTQLDPLPWLQLSVGGRYDFFRSRGEGKAAANLTNSASRFSPNASVMVTPVEGVQFYASYREGMRAPNLRELYWNYLDNVFMNPDLKPEISKSREAGINILRDGLLWPDDKLRLKFAYYDNHYRDYIQTMPISGFRYHFANIPKARHEGIDISASYDNGWLFAEAGFNHFLAIELCTINEGCRLAKGDVMAIMGPPDFANYRPARSSGSATLGVRLFDRALTLGGRMRFSSVRYGSKWPPSSNSSLGMQGTWPAYEVYDLFGSLAITEDTLLNVSVENVTDRYYLVEASTSGIPAPGRTGRVTFTHRFSGAPGFLPRIPEIGLGRASHGAPGDSWTGLYAGFHAGYVSAKVSGETTAGDGSPVAASESADYKKDKAQIGVHLGFNYQLPGRVILGIEGDLTSLGHESAWSGTPVSESAELAAAGNLEAETRFGLDSLSTLRVRLGYAPQRTFFYATGGVAFLNEYGARSQYRADRASQALPFGNQTQFWFSEAAEVTRTGWTAGGGIEHMIGRHISLKGEFLHARFGDSEALSFDEARQGIARRYVYSVREEVCTGTRCRWVTTTVIVPGSSETAAGRKSHNRAYLNSLRVGVSYRF
ncbi:TonB-dependent receptor [Sandaracinobacter sp. RS1-74]|uniref:TonB-dependent receptor domain-containing protein n=1 Tax=Sandaracinobacteroides sayramensis TaxID=2913411 RepID=UPI001EDAF40F|nr:TonB-dependent receptor [Sandaracinobacteroides sayramensis]MCG2840693.1 TonB-dependent receptor [Sandaracinobacteroides sayramensis]